MSDTEVTFSVSESQAVVQVDLMEDTAYEGVEEFTATLSLPTSAQRGVLLGERSSVQVTVEDNDSTCRNSMWSGSECV